RGGPRERRAGGGRGRGRPQGGERSDDPPRRPRPIPRPRQPDDLPAASAGRGDRMSPPADSAPAPVPVVTERVRDHPVEREMHRSYIDYAMSVIIGRALPY